MKTQLKQKSEDRESPTLGIRVRDSVVGIGIIALVGFLKFQSGLGDLYFGLGLLLGGNFISKSLTMDLLSSFKDVIQKRL